jgi:hypothetical protein
MSLVSPKNKESIKHDATEHGPNFSSHINGEIAQIPWLPVKERGFEQSHQQFDQALNIDTNDDIINFQREKIQINDPYYSTVAETNDLMAISQQMSP